MGSRERKGLVFGILIVVALKGFVFGGEGASFGLLKMSMV